MKHKKRIDAGPLQAVLVSTTSDIMDDQVFKDKVVDRKRVSQITTVIEIDPIKTRVSDFKIVKHHIFDATDLNARVATIPILDASIPK